MTINIAALDGLTLHGGCEHCQAQQTINANAHGPHAHALVITHDDHCPWCHGGNRANRRARRRYR
ncbi:hypothetical protein [Micromonospora aurantiaca (nom. illeg.)]|uniref:hypothetical protein n=1 Tax=Micromonospora aurantiaca (nom. illeg.) TaxID=47850 RepID=UPI0036992780